MRIETVVSKLIGVFKKKKHTPASSSSPITSNHILGMAITAAAAFLFAVQSNPGQKAELSMISDPNLMQNMKARQHQSANPDAPQEAPVKHDFRQSALLQVQQGDTLFDLLKDKGIPPPQIQQLVSVARPVHNLGRLKEGQVATLDFDERDGKIYRFAADFDEDRLIVERNEEELKARKEVFHFDIRRKTVSGTIDDSLFLAADQAGLPPSLILALADIFAYDIDFHTDIQSQDTFVALFEEKYLNGRLAQTGRILAAGIVNGGKPYWAFLYETKDGNTGYYNEKGKPLRKAFLKSPLKYTRISSSYSNRRFHPVLKIYRPHLGVDYAAPTGTPIRAVADGKILFAGWKGGYGNFVKIQHNGTYSSTYGHMQKFAKKARRGNHVGQGEVIGYVGATGMATGPHLDFRMLKNGKFVNPLKLNFSDAEPLAGADRTDFDTKMQQYMRELENNTYDSSPLQMISLQLSQITS